MAVAQPVARPDAPDPQLVALKLPPHSVEAEQSLLGALLLDNQAFDRVADLVGGGGLLPRRPPPHLAPHRAPDRGDPARRRRHGVGVDRGERGQGQDRRRRLPGGAGAEHAERAQHPPLRRAGARARGAAAPRAGGDRDRRERARAHRQGGRAAAGRGRVEDLPDRRIRRAQATRACSRSSRCWRRVFERIDHLYHQDNPSDVTGVPTGYIELDEMTSGLQPRRPDHHRRRARRMGKTALALNIAEHVAVDNGLPVAIFSMEMSAHAARHAHAGLDRARRPAQDAHRPPERQGMGRPVGRHGQAARDAASSSTRRRADCAGGARAGAAPEAPVLASSA